MADFDTNELLIASGVITRELAERAAQIPPTVSSSRVGRLIAAGADAKKMLESLTEMTGIPLAPREMLEWATPVLILPSTARQLRDILACPVRRDAQGTLHVVIADPETQRALEKLLIDFKVHLAPEASVRSLLQTLYSMGPAPSSEPMEAIDIDLEASRQNVRAPATVPEAIDIDLDASQRMPAAPPAPPRDPLAARPSSSFKRPKDDDETQRVQRSPRAPAAPSAPTAPTAPTAPITVRTVAALDDQTIESMPAPRVARDMARDAAERRAFLSGVLAGVAGTAVVAAIVIVALFAR